MTAVVEFPLPSLIDIPGQLRLLADYIEANPDESTKCIVLTSDSESGSFPAIYAYGHIENTADIVYNLEKAKLNLLTPPESDG